MPSGDEGVVYNDIDCVERTVGGEAGQKECVLCEGYGPRVVGVAVAPVQESTAGIGGGGDDGRHIAGGLGGDGGGASGGVGRSYGDGVGTFNKIGEIRPAALVRCCAATGNIDIGRCRYSPENVIAQCGRYASLAGNGSEVAAIMEGIIANGSDRTGDDHGIETDAKSESRTAYGSDGVGDGNRCEADATVEGPFWYGGDRIGDGH